MPTFEFELRYRLGAAEEDVDEAVERLGAIGCTDSLIGTGLPGVMALQFHREGRSAFDAVRSALTDCQRAMPTAQLTSVSPDLVGLTDVADLIGVSRQNMRKLMLANPSFPAPVHSGSTSVWHLTDVLPWLQQKGTYAISQTTLELAKVTEQINALRESLRVVPSTARKFERFVS